MVAGHLSRMFEHVEWADRRVLEAIRASGEPTDPVVARLFSHVLAAERVWLLRLKGQDSSEQPVWPELSLQEMESLARANAGEFRDLIAHADQRGLASLIRYVDTRGVKFETSAIDILTHVALHGSYHRGQIAQRVRDAGAEPVGTDYIVFARANPPEVLAPDAAPG